MGGHKGPRSLGIWQLRLVAKGGEVDPTDLREGGATSELDEYVFDLFGVLLDHVVSFGPFILILDELVCVDKLEVVFDAAQGGVGPIFFPIGKD